MLFISGDPPREIISCHQQYCACLIDYSPFILIFIFQCTTSGIYYRKYSFPVFRLYINI